MHRSIRIEEREFSALRKLADEASNYVDALAISPAAAEAALPAFQEAAGQWKRLEALYLELERIAYACRNGRSGVYVAQHSPGSNLYKIGQSGHIPQRLAGLRRDSPELRLAHAVICGNDRGAVEVSLHRRFAKQHQGKEWFILSGADVEWIKSL